MIFLGKQFDSVNMSISIPADKLTEIRQIIEKLLLKKTVTRKKLESNCHIATEVSFLVV
jgi:hypothetical protein